MSSSTRRLTTMLVVVAGLMAAAQGWAFRHHTSTDGIAYLDMADGFARFDWRTALNGYWSPLYPFVIGMVFALVRPSSYWEFAWAHAVNGVIFAAALFAFHLFLRQLIAWSREAAAASAAGVQPLSERALTVIGYVLFLWGAVRLIGVGTLTPDLIVAGLVFGVSASLLRLTRGHGGAGTWVGLGVLLGTAYLAKAVMFPLAWLFLAVAAIAARRERRRAWLAVAAFVLVSAPLVAALSVSKGRLTFGDTGLLNYAWYVNGVPFEHWQGQGPGNGTPAHPTRRISVEPPAYEFGSPLVATYPPWFDPSYWNEGVRTRFDANAQARALMQSLRVYARVLVVDLAMLVGACFVLFWAARRNLRGLGTNWMLLVPSVCAWALYAPVHVEPRFLGGFVTVFWMAVLGGIWLPAGDRALTPRAAVAVAAVTLGASLILFTARAVTETERLLTGLHQMRYRIAEGLQAHGAAPGDPVACVGRACDYVWARVARVRVVASAPPPVTAVPPVLFARFAEAGASLVMATDEHDVPGVEWHRIAGTDRQIAWVKQ